jgi:hypothetical protein
VFEDIWKDFQMLVLHEGITPTKVESATATLAMLGELIPKRAMQRIIDDVVDLGGDDAEALLWALRAHPDSAEWRALNTRREKSGLPKNTAMDREKRAVQKLFEKWSRPREFWASAVYGTMAKFLPVTGKVQIGSYEAEVEVLDDPEQGLPVIWIRSDRPDADCESLTVLRQENHTQVVFFTSKYPWRLHLTVRRVTEESLLIYRRFTKDPPIALLMELPDQDGGVTVRSVPQRTFVNEPMLTIPSDLLDDGFTLTWWWSDPEVPKAEVDYTAEDAT